MTHAYTPIAESSADLARRGFRRVYQGGHHDVWCDGAVHQTRFGAGYASAAMGSDSVEHRPWTYPCDCARYSAASHTDPAIPHT